MNSSGRWAVGSGQKGVVSSLPTAHRPLPTAGVTLIEMLIVLILIGLMVGITFPAVSSGLDSVRLREASDNIASFMNGALNRAERRQEVIELTISKTENQFSLESAQGGFVKKLKMPPGISIKTVRPADPSNPDAARRFLLFPDGTVPRISVEISSSRGFRRLIRVDPITGVPVIEPVKE